MSPRILYETHMKVIEQEHKISRNSPLTVTLSTKIKFNQV